jgi:carbon monoxide dehydrogenase subunit G
MKLEFSGAPEISAPRDTVWERLMDPNFVAASAPGVESVEAVDATHFKVVSGLGVGAVKVKFKLDVELSDVVRPERLRMAARGKAPGSAVDVISTVRLEEIDNGRTRLKWSATSDISGTVASVGARLLEGTARRLTEEFWTDFARRVSAEG